MPLAASPPPPSDLALPGALSAAIASRAFRGEMILFSFDFCGISGALSLLIHLRSISFEHFLPLGDGKETCEAMQKLATSHGIDPVPCYFSHALNNHSGWIQWGSGPSCVSAARPNHYCSIEQLWATRYHIAALLLATGKVNIINMDTDTVILSDPYAILKAPPYADVNLILLLETPVNGGLWYAQNTRAGGGAQWVIGEVARRTQAAISVNISSRSSVPFDQAFLGDVLITAATGKNNWGAACENRFLARTHLCNPQYTRNAHRMQWPHGQALKPPTNAAAGSLIPILRSRVLGANVSRCNLRCGSRRCKERCSPSVEFTWNCSSDVSCPTWRMRYADLWVHGESRVEHAALAAPWLFPQAWRAQIDGVFSRRPAPAAVAHLLGVRCRWCLSSFDPDHGAKWEWQHLAGFFSEKAYNIAPPLATPDHSNAASSDLRRKHRARRWRDSELESDFGGLASPLEERMLAHCRWRGRAAQLYADRRILSIAPNSPDLRKAEAADDNGMAARRLIRRLVNLAAITGRMAVLPSFNCSSPWIRKNYAADGTIVVTDLRVVVVNMSAGRPIHSSRCAPCNVAFGCRAHVLSEAQHAAARRLRQTIGESPDSPRALQRGTQSSKTHTSPRRAMSSLASIAVDSSQGFAQLSLPLRKDSREGHSQHIVDLDGLWSLLATPLKSLSGESGGAPSTPSSFTALGAMQELEVVRLADVQGDACTLDLEMLRKASRIAFDVVQIHCGVGYALLSPGRPCPWTAEEVWAALHRWEHLSQERCERGAPRDSPLVARLSFRCYDMLCSDEFCHEVVINTCVGRLDNELRLLSNVSVPKVDSMETESETTRQQRLRAAHLRSRCEGWLRSLPRSVRDPGALCNPLQGSCRLPPDVYPKRAFWPTARCLHVGAGRTDICATSSTIERGGAMSATRGRVGKATSSSQLPSSASTPACGPCWRG